ncbi:hypothetical protein JNUCC64_01105 [Streptomyces sp. JNUCC 64]
MLARQTQCVRNFLAREVDAVGVTRVERFPEPGPGPSDALHDLLGEQAHGLSPPRHSAESIW